MQTIKEKGTQVFQIRADTCTCGNCFFQCSDVISLLVHKSQHAIAENVYKCDLCRSLHSTQEALCSHYLTHHKVLAKFFTKTEVLAADVVEMPGDRMEGLQSETIAILDTEDKSIKEWKALDMVDGNNITEEKSNPPVIFNSEDVKSVHIEVTQEPEPEPLQTSDAVLCLSGVVESTGSAPVSSVAKPKGSKQPTEDNQLQFLLVTECSSSCNRPYLKTWFLCLFCSYKTRTRAAFVKHVKNIHRKKLKHVEGINIIDIVDSSGVKKGKTEDVTFGWNLITMEDYDKFVPVVNTKDEALENTKKNERRLEKQDILGKFPCNKCSKVFNRVRYLRRHLVNHKDEKPHSCSECKKCFKTKDQLKVHQKSCLKPSKLYECPQCDFKSKINTVIHAHRQLHPDGCIICHVCGKAYADKSTLMKHMHVHDPNRPYACTVSGCMWRFKSEIMFRAHLRAHSTKGKFLCSHCGYAFRHKHHLLRHQTSVHGIEPPKPRPYGQGIKEEVERDIVEIPADQLEIHETAFLDQPIFMTGESDVMISESTDLSSINTLIQTHVVTKPDCNIIFEHKSTV